jgi:hypothetical protein
MSSDWADEKAREWLVNSGLCYNREETRKGQWTPSLATLLREVEDNTAKGFYAVMADKEEDGLSLVQESTRQALLFEVRQAVGEVVRETFVNADMAELLIKLILRRLEAL